MNMEETKSIEETKNIETAEEPKNLKKKKKGVGRVLLWIPAVFFAALLLLGVAVSVRRSTVHSFGDRLKTLEGVSSVERIWQIMPIFEEKYLVTFTQPLDWEDPSKGTFEQRVEIGYKGDDRINVYHAGGYCLYDMLTGGKTYFRLDDRDEPARMYDGNYISMEYRFFGKSLPEGFSHDGTYGWEYLTAENAAKDFCAVMEKLSTVLPGKKVFTGASKGGFTTNTMALLHPDSCDAFIAYVAPLCDGPEDARLVDNVYETIGNVGHPAEEAQAMRDTVMKFEVYCIEHREPLQEMYYQAAMKAGCVLRDTVTEEILWDMTVLEFGLQHWQYGGDFDELEELLAMPETSEKELEKKLKKIGKYVAEKAEPANWSTTYFALPYYWQALCEMGSYHYDYSYLREAVIEKTGKDMLVITEDMQDGIIGRLLFTPEQLKLIEYDGSLREKMIGLSETTTAHLIRVDGGCDVWYAVRIPDAQNENVHTFTVDAGCHSAGIKDLSEEDQAACRALLDQWLLP